ncbi:MAG TPA: LacI family DNA-binding transcriptional regulator [Verrucomicrobiae bacterium]|nr:LacI family DNA-binding transcriptional regulator [Verrucomicrobiae bacterium]
MTASNLVTMRDLAKVVGVSHSTISLALRNDPSIPLSRRREVKRVAKRMGYRPDPLLTSLVYYRHRNRLVKIQSALAWINHWEQPEQLRKHREFDAYWKGAARAAERFGYRLDELQWTSDYSAKRFERILHTRNVRGILIPPHLSPPDWGRFDWSKFSIIRFGMSVPKPDSHLVTADHQRAVLMAFNRIYQYGYQRIGLAVCGNFDRRLGGNYTGGLYAAQKLFGFKHILPPLMTDEHVYSDNPVKAKRLLREWLLKYCPDAILTTVPQVPEMIRDLGFSIPRDIAVAGTSLQDIPVDAGINQNPEEIGRIAAEMLVAQINVNEQGEPKAPCRILVESSWQDGKSLPRRSGT